MDFKDFIWLVRIKLKKKAISLKIDLILLFTVSRC